MYTYTKSDPCDMHLTTEYTHTYSVHHLITKERLLVFFMINNIVSIVMRGK